MEESVIQLVGFLMEEWEFGEETMNQHQLDCKCLRVTKASERNLWSSSENFYFTIPLNRNMSGLICLIEACRHLVGKITFHVRQIQSGDGKIVLSDRKM
jgi:hypothetical protein